MEGTVMAPATDLLRVENLSVSFSLMGGKLDAVRRADLRVLPGKVTALVGESGSGKSVISQAIMGILPQVATAAGKIVFHDAAAGKAPVDLLSLPKDWANVHIPTAASGQKVTNNPLCTAQTTSSQQSTLCKKIIHLTFTQTAKHSILNRLSTALNYSRTKA